MSRASSSLALIGILSAVFSVLLAAGSASAQVRMVELDEITQEVTLENFGASTVDVGGYFLCRAPGTYQAVGALSIVSGSTTLSPGAQLEVVYTAILSTGTGIGLYLNSSGFANSANMADYMQYQGVSGVRESVAVSAGIWTAGTFATGAGGPYFYLGDGATQNGAAFWTNALPVAQTPALSNAGVGVLVALLLVLALTLPRVLAGSPRSVSAAPSRDRVAP